MKGHLICLHRLRGRAGRENEKGRVIIQTYNPENFCIEQAKKQDYDLFYETEIKLRKQLKYPPFCDIILFNISSNNEKKVEQSAKKLHEILKKNVGKYKVQIEMFNPVIAPISKIKNKYRWRIILKCKLGNNILEYINNSLEEYYKLKIKDTRVIVDTNPNNMN